MANFSIGQRITARGEDFMVVNSQPLDNGEWVIEARGLSELVKDQYYYFDTNLDKDIKVIDPSMLKQSNRVNTSTAQNCTIWLLHI